MKRILVTQPSMPGLEEYMEEIRELWDSRWITNMGVKHRELEERLARYLRVPNIELFANGHLALECAIAAFQLSGEIITTPFTFVSTTHAIVRNGLTPVFCDIEPDTYTIDVNKLEELINEKTSAIIPVHVYGNICDVEAIASISKRYNLKVIYDAAHAFGETVNGKGIGIFGDASAFSFHATKVFNTIEGGAVTFCDESLRDILCCLRNFGLSGAGAVKYCGSNAKMNEFQAAMGICNLRHIEEETEKRRAVADRYRERLGNVRGIRLSPCPKGVKSNYAYFPVVFDGYRLDRDQVYDLLRKNNIMARKYFYPLTNSLDCYKDKFNCHTPVAEQIAGNVLTLPLYADLALEDVDRICEIILK